MDSNPVSAIPAANPSGAEIPGLPLPPPAQGLDPSVNSVPRSDPAVQNANPDHGMFVPIGREGRGGEARFSRNNLPLGVDGGGVVPAGEMYTLNHPNGGTIQVPADKIEGILSLLNGEKSNDLTGKVYSAVPGSDERVLTTPESEADFMKRAKAGVRKQVDRRNALPMGQRWAQDHPKEASAARERIANGVGTHRDYWLSGSVKGQSGDEKRVAQLNQQAMQKMAMREAKQTATDKAARDHQNALELAGVKNDKPQTLRKGGTFEFALGDGKPQKTDLMYDDGGNLVPTSNQLQWVESWNNDYQKLVSDKGEKKAAKSDEGQRLLGNLKVFGITDPVQGAAQIQQWKGSGSSASGATADGLSADEKRARIRAANPGRSDDDLKPLFTKYGV